MTIEPPRTATEAEDPEQLYCYGHPNTPTRLRCSRCDRPICGRCSIPATVGQHCPECVAEARRTAPKVRTTMAALAPATRAILFVSIAVFLGQMFVPGLTNRFAAIPLVIAAGEWWRLLTPVVLHAGVFHIFMNMYVLTIFGPMIERLYGTPPFVTIYVIAGFTGSVASYLFSACTVRAVGASGAIFGIAGALFVYFWRRRELRTMAPYINSLALFIGLNILIGFGFNFLGFAVQIDNYAHIGGLLGGALVGFGLDRRTGDVPLSQYVSVATLVTAAGIALVMWRTATFTC
ncbi:MAG: rhomboid family intramembrane serine protease [Actinomycetota bacterium]|nr:rhomboid family intramembrane serine protease [Actinomycetota bacterium]